MPTAYSVTSLDDAPIQRSEDGPSIAEAPLTVQHNIGGGAFPEPAPLSPGDEA